MLSADELGLIADHGLTYIEPDPVAHVVFPDGDSLTMWLDLDRTCERSPITPGPMPRPTAVCCLEYDAVKDVFHRQRFTPVGLGPSLDEMLDGRPAARAGAGAP